MYQLPEELERLREVALMKRRERLRLQEESDAGDAFIVRLRRTWYDLPKLAGRLGVHRKVLYNNLSRLTTRQAAGYNTPYQILIDDRLEALCRTLFIPIAIDPD